VSNLTRGWSRAVIDLTISYDTDLDRALQVLHDEAMRFEHDAEWSGRLSGPVQALGVQDLSNVGVVIRIVARTFPGSQFEVGRELRRRLKNRMDAEGIEIPILQAAVHVGLVPRARDEVRPQEKP
jgi:moderate conductance mechanosensitive channel